jgi:1-acyl-sn-glycerol-3-phosphate acyltransferase
MSKIIGVLRFFGLMVLVLAGLIAGLVSPLMSGKFHRQFIKKWHQAVVWIVGVQTEYSGAGFADGALIVCNHVSWLDISVLGSRYPVIFLAKAEIAGWPVLGYVVRKAGTLFIARGKGSAGAVESISSALSVNQSVVIFPEGRTTDGLDVARFAPRLFEAAIRTGQPVQALGLRYHDGYGDILTDVSYVGDMSFMQSLWKVLCVRGKSVKIHLFDPVSGPKSRDSVSKNAREQIRDWLPEQMSVGKFT